jgi:ADP-ribose pyrophosphatase YjhB (NUDIX family)
MEPGENLTEACAREVKEEAGIQVRVGRLISVYTSPHVLLEYPDGNSHQLVILHFAAVRIGGEIQTSDETTDVAFFTREEIEQIELSGLTRMRIEDSFTDSVEALVRDDYELR